MEISSIMLHLPTDPDTPPEQVLVSATLLAQLLKAKLTASVCQLDSNPATWPPSLGSWPVNLYGMMDDAVHRSVDNAQRLTDKLMKLGAEYHVTIDIRRRLTTLYASPQSLVDISRLHDLTVIPFPELDGLGQAALQAMIFDTGRPTLLLPTGDGRKPFQAMENIVVAWDRSREASRALGDAMPLLALAGRVHIFSVLGEKMIRSSCKDADLDQYLALHGIRYQVEERDVGQGSVAECIASFAIETGADLLVMGAYGHSRLREFVFGGATRGLLSNPPLPILLSH